MIIEKQVCGLELAKRLKELGVKQESFFYWKTDGGNPYLVAWNSRYMTSKGEIQGAAFTVAELGEILPVTVHGDFDHLICDKAIKHWSVYYSRDRSGIPRATNGGLYLQTEETEADARAKMLIYLVKKGLLTL
jgi:hypothetical protein